MSEFKEAILALETSVKAESKDMIEKSLESLTGEFGQKLNDSSEEVKTMVKDQIALAEKALGDKFNEFSAKLNEKKAKETEVKETFGTSMKKALSENFEQIKGVRKGNAVEVKAVANMLTTGDHVTGDYIRDYNRTVITLPGQALNVSDLIPSIAIDGGTYTYIRETGQEGAFAYQTEGSDKALVDADFSHIDVTTDFLAGRTIYSKKMRNNLQYLQSYLPEALRKRYFIAENADFYTKIAAAATVSAQRIAATPSKAEMINKDIAVLEGANYSGANGIVMNVADWYDVIDDEKSTGSGYGLPIGWTYEGGVLRAYGIPVFKANWMASNKYLLADWSMVEKVVTEGLSLEFSEDERFSKNEIVARLEAQVGLAVKQPASLIIGDFVAV